MTSNLLNRLRKLERASNAERSLSPEEVEQSMVELAAQYGHTKESAIATFGGWPGVCAHYLVEAAHAAADDEPGSNHGLTAGERYLAALK